MILWNSPWESGGAPASKSHNTVGTSLCPGHPGFFHSQVILTEPPAIHQLELRFSSHGTGCSGGLRPGTLLQLICYSPYPMVVALTSGQQLALCSPLSHGSERSWWFLNLFSFLLVMMELQIPSSSCMEPEKPLSLYLTDLFNGLKYHLKEDIILNLQYFWLKWYTTKIMTKAKIKYLKIHYWLKEME